MYDKKIMPQHVAIILDGNGNTFLKKEEKKGDISKDIISEAEDEVQDLTDIKIKEIDAVTEKKIKEIMSV